MDEEIKKILEQNLELTEKINKNTKYIKRYVITSQIFGFIKLMLIVVPIILGIIYLPPLIKDLINQYQSILGIGGEGGDLIGNLLKGGTAGLDLRNIDLNSIPPEIFERAR